MSADSTGRSLYDLFDGVRADGPFSPYDSRCREPEVEFSRYIHGHQGLSETERGELIIYHQLVLTEKERQGALSQARITYRYARDLSIRNLTTLPWRQLPFQYMVLKAVMTPNGYSDFVHHHIAKRARYFDQKLREQHSPGIRAAQSELRACETRWQNRCETGFSLSAKAVWNALGGKRQAFPRFTLTSCAESPRL